MPEWATVVPGDAAPPAARLELRLFGAMQAVLADGSPSLSPNLLPNSRKARAILAVLALAEGRPVARSALIQLLWPLRGRPQAQASLRQSIHELRETLAGLPELAIVSVGEHLALHAPSMWVDAIWVGSHHFGASEISEVLKGALLGDLFGLSKNFDDWIVAERKRLEGVLRIKIDTFLRHAADHDDTLRIAEAALAYDASFEGAWQALAQSHKAMGNQDCVLEAYRKCLSEVRRSGGRLAFNVDTLFAPHLPSGVAVSSGPAATEPSRPSSPHVAWAQSRNAIRIAIAPMKALGDATLDFAESIEWQILSNLYKFDNFSCVPVGAARDSELSPPRLAADGFDLLLETCVERWSDRDQFVLRLRDLHLNGEIFWSHRLRRATSPILCVQDDVAPVLASQIAAEIAKHQAAFLKQSPEHALNFPQLIQKAASSIHAMSRQSLTEADQILFEAIKRDHNHPAPLAWCAYVQLLELGQGWAREVEGTQRCIGDLIDRSLSLNPQEASVLSIAGHVLAFTQNRLDEGLSLQEQALDKNPNLPSAWLFSGLAHSYAGEHEQAIHRLQRAKLLSPADQQAYFMEMGLSLSLLLNGDPGRALQASRHAIRLNPNFSSSYKVALAAWGYDEAARSDRSLLKRLLQLEPSLTVEKVVSRSPLRRSVDRARLAEGLRLAGLPKQ